jgi:hypothetical protein
VRMHTHARSLPVNCLWKSLEEGVILKVGRITANSGSSTLDNNLSHRHHWEWKNKIHMIA